MESVLIKFKKENIEKLAKYDECPESRGKEAFNLPECHSYYA